MSRARKGSIDRQTVVDAAYRVATRVGLDRMSMRMVADELGVSTMAAYRHVPDRETLVGLVADQLAASVEVPDPDSGPWDQRLLELERSAFRASSLVPSQPDSTVIFPGPNQRRIVDGSMKILAEAGFDDEEAAVAFEVIWAYFQGQLRVYDLLVAGRDGPDGPTEPRARPLLDPVMRMPQLSPEEYFERGFVILLDGLRARLAEKQATTATTTVESG
jgi:AcrR family transcriptional regulator